MNLQSTNSNLSNISHITSLFTDSSNKETLWDLCSTSIFQNIPEQHYSQVQQIFDITINKISNDIQSHDSLISCNKRFLARLHNDLPNLLPIPSTTQQPKSILKPNKPFHSKKSDSTDSIQRLYQEKENELKSYIPKPPSPIDLSDHTEHSTDDVLLILEQQKKEREKQSISFESILSQQPNTSNHKITIHNSYHIPPNEQNDILTLDSIPITQQTSEISHNPLDFLKKKVPNSSSNSNHFEELVNQQKETNHLLSQMNSMLSILCDELKRNA